MHGLLSQIGGEPLDIDDFHRLHEAEKVDAALTLVLRT